MNLRKLITPVLCCCMALTLACQKTDDLRAAIDQLRDRIAALEKEVIGINDNISALHKLLAQGALIVGVTPTESGYKIELSDGTRIQITLNTEINALVPVLGIDNAGFWIFSVDKGATFTRLLIDGKPLSAYPQLDGTPSPDAKGNSPKLKVDADGYWLVSLDGGVTWSHLLQQGEKVYAVAQNVPFPYSGFFKTVTYDNAQHILAVELLDGTKFTFPVEDTFGLKIEAAESETFYLNDRRVFLVQQTSIKEAFIQAPAGWKVTLDQEHLTVISPTTAPAAEQAIVISVIVTSEKSYIKSSTLHIKFLNTQRDAGTSLAWQKFKAGASDNLLLDFSYAGYKHGEVAPPDGLTLGYTVYDITAYGADPTGVTSSRPALIALLETLKLTGKTATGSNQSNANARAVIYFPAGRYILHSEDDNTVDPASKNQTHTDSKGNNKSSSISIRGGNYVIKGAGRDKTTLIMATPNLPDDPIDMWSSPVMLNLQHYSAPSDLTTVSADAAKGTFAVEVASTMGISSGDWICLALSNNSTELVAQELAPHVVDFEHMTNIQTITITDYHQVKSIDGNRVTFHEPLMHAVEAKWGWKIRKYPHYENVGIEDLSFEGYSKEGFKHHESWEDDGAYKPLNMLRLTNAWLRRVDFRSISEALSIASSANCSAYDVTISGNRGHASIRSQGSSRVFIGKVIDHASGWTNDPTPAQPNTYKANAGQYHATGVSQTSMGAVLWNNTWGEDAMFESHSSQPRATLVDRCTGGFVQWRFGGDKTAVPNHLDDLTMWNFNAITALADASNTPFKWWITSSYWWKVLPPTIVGHHGAAVDFDPSRDQVKLLESNGTAVQPESLYEAQLRERLGYVPAWLSALK